MDLRERGRVKYLLTVGVGLPEGPAIDRRTGMILAVVQTLEHPQ